MIDLLLFVCSEAVESPNLHMSGMLQGPQLPCLGCGV